MIVALSSGYVLLMDFKADEPMIKSYFKTSESDVAQISYSSESNLIIVSSTMKFGETLVTLIGSQNSILQSLATFSIKTDVN
jgi:hypothetical protein